MHIAVYWSIASQLTYEYTPCHGLEIQMWSYVPSPIVDKEPRDAGNKTAPCRCKVPTRSRRIHVR